MIYFKERVDTIAGDAIWMGLPKDLQDVPKLVTEKTGIEVDILPLEACSVPLFRIEKAAAALDIDGDAQRITVWCDPEKITAFTLGHELIHLRRYVLEGTPVMAPFRCGPRETSLILMVENELEHLLIIPEEIKRFTDSEDWWSKHYSELVDTIVARPKPSILELIFTWTQLRSSLPSQMEIARKLGAHLQSLGPEFVRTVDHIRCNAMESLPDKVRLLTLFSGELKEISQCVAIGRWEMSGGRLEFSYKMAAGLRLS
ncbi:hypothetical protein FGA82_07370 [Pseudomonas fluorescens]|uniref:hypothetical protein n=1 Tax=Pseudomonas fluorescens TaxID=294 RepID=UPI00113013FC|nr:hypothetical protein [Pseudomonas fluorescens]TMU81371.1 hypothetical protein FGA82_07370 [Pseudomonas fluorescens]